MKNKLFLSLAVIATALTSCSKEENNNTPLPSSEYKEVTLSRKTNYGNDWIYFSLSQGKEVSMKEGEHLNDLSWDIAFNRMNIRTNGGKSGKGKGGAFDTKVKDFKAVITAPENGYEEDKEGEITSKFTGEGIETIKSTLNHVLASAILFSGPPPTYLASEKVFIVKTADGKFAKFQVLGYHNKQSQAGYVTFRYFLQKDGSRNLK